MSGYFRRSAWARRSKGRHKNAFESREADRGSEGIRTPHRGLHPDEESRPTSLLLHFDKSEVAVRVVGSRGEIHPICGTVVGRASAKFNSPNAVDADGLAEMANQVDELAGLEVEGIDGSDSGVIGDKQCSAQRTEGRRRDRKTPGLVEDTARGEALHELALLGEDRDVSAALAVGGCKRDIKLAADILNAKRREAIG